MVACAAVSRTVIGMCLSGAIHHLGGVYAAAPAEGRARIRRQTKKETSRALGSQHISRSIC